jgi:acyl dehydratase
MPISPNARHIVEQRRVLGSLLGTAARALLQRARGGPAEDGRPPPPLPGPELVAQVKAPPTGLIRDYVRHVGGDPGAYLGQRPPTVPPHLFPHWTFPLAARVLRDVPYPLLRILNSGCRLEMNAPLPAGAPLMLRAQLVAITEDEHRAVLHQRIVTSTPADASALVVDLYAVVPTGTRATNGATRPRRAVAAVPPSARELASWTLRPDAGLEFAFLTGDFNPVHWVRRYARAAGFASPILHGFAMMARTMESLGRTVLAGATDRIAVFDVKFTRPLPLGRGVQVGLYLERDGRSFALADAPGGRAYLVGTFAARGRQTEKESGNE